MTALTPAAAGPQATFELDPGTHLSEWHDGSFYLATGDDYYDARLTRERAEALRDWLTERLGGNAKP